MEEERSHLQEVIGKMEARLNEQSRLLEQVGCPPTGRACVPSTPGMLPALPFLPFLPSCLPRPGPSRSSVHRSLCPLSSKRRIFEPLHIFCIEEQA